MDVIYAGVALNDGSRESPSNLVTDLTRSVQTVARTRSNTATIFPRKNSIFSISFSIAYEKADLPAAEQFAAEIDEWLPLQGELTLIPADSNGAVQEVTYENAALTNCRASQTGVTVFVSFSFLATNRKQLPE